MSPILHSVTAPLVVLLLGVCALLYLCLKFRRKQTIHREVAKHTYTLHMTVEALKAAKELAELRAERYRKLMEMSPDAILLARNGYFEDANQAAVRLFGVSFPEELMGRRLEEFVTPEFRDAVAEVREELFSRPIQLPQREMRIVNAGSPIDVEIAGASFLDSAGAHVQAIIRDISRRKRAEESLRISETRLRAITDSARDAILMMDPSGAISYWNPAAESMLGYTYQEAIGQNLHHLLVPGRYLPAFQAAHPEFLRSGRGNAIGKTSELTARCKDGREIIVEISLSAIRLKGEWHAIGILRDVSLRKQAELALRDSEEKFRQLAENIREVFFVLSPAGYETLYVSPAYQQIWGRSCESIYQNPRSWQDAIHPDDLQYIRELAEKRYKGLAAQFEYRIRTPDGVEKWIRSRSFPVYDQAGELVRIVGIAEEITERKRYETELIRARELAESANRAKTMFLATMSHELRTPLNAILGFTELLEVEMADRGIHDWDKDIQKIRRAGNHLFALVNDIMDLSKIEAGKFTLNPEDFEVAGLITEVASSMEAMAAKNHVELTVECQPATLYGDRLRIGQAIFNLVGNACKFTHHGRVLVQARSESGRGRDWYTIRVADTGIGIRPEDLPRLFSQFSQLDDSPTRKYGGTGLGLAISRKLCRLMGGDITVESKFGEGSVFTIRIPADVHTSQPAESQMETVWQ